MTGKEITLGDWLKGMQQGIGITIEPGNKFAVIASYGLTSVPGPTPEDALQALCESYHGDPDALLDIGRSRKWEQAHGPDGVAGLCKGEAGVVVCRDGALHLVEKLQFPSPEHMGNADRVLQKCRHTVSPSQVATTKSKRQPWWARLWQRLRGSRPEFPTLTATAAEPLLAGELVTLDVEGNLRRATTSARPVGIAMQATLEGNVVIAEVMGHHAIKEESSE